ncbi:DUF262 domain-containing protein [Myxococcota bacterium]|nr:DUF262 domain-containing protein [Myxococcota bacterium]
MQAATATSVRDILASTGRDDDAWRLAIVQRERVWDAFKAAKLFDSLLAGFPIGSLLLCRSADPTAAIVRDGDGRIVEEASDAWQILDGQQRTWALSVLFGPPLDEEAASLEFFFRPGAPREELRPGAYDKRIHRWITWRDHGWDPFAVGDASREEWVSVRRLGKALLDREHPDDLLTDKSALATWFSGVDPEHAATVLDAAALRRLRNVVNAWATPFIPVQRIVLDGPEDVLEVFERANMEGVRTSAADIFFAAVKSRWVHAEAELDGFRGRTGALSRMDALRIVARGASLKLGVGDPVPLHVKRLYGEKGGELVAAMHTVTRRQEIRDAVDAMLDTLAHRTPLGWGLRLVDRYLVDAVVIWACQQAEAGRDPTSDPSQVSNAAAWLFWGTAFRLQPVLRETYARAMLGQLVEHDDATFPVDRLFAAARGVSSTLSYQRSAVPRPFEGEVSEQERTRRDCVNARGRLFLSVAQQIPFKPTVRIDWDHIFPQAQRHKLKWRGEDGKAWLSYHPGNSAMWRAGNLCGLDAAVNRGLQDRLPRDKLARLDEAREGGRLAIRDVFLSAEDRERLCEVHDLLEHQDGRAPALLKAIVDARERALWAEAERRFPQVHAIARALFDLPE